MTQTKVGWRPYVSQIVNAVDADATAFITAAGITNLTQAAAINTLVMDLKTYGIWTKMKALYPFVGGSASSHKFNLKDPRDLDAAYRLYFTGGGTHDSLGYKTNGTNAWANTFFNPRNDLTFGDLHLSIYTRNRYPRMNGNDIGPIAGYTTAGWTALRGTSNNSGPATGLELFGTSDETNGGVSYASTSVGFSIGSHTSTSRKYYKNGILGVTGVGNNTTPYINANLSINGNTNELSQAEYALASLGQGLSDTEAANFYTAVQKFQTTLGRQVGVPVVADTDAQAFLNAASITDTTQASAVNTLVTDLKTAGIWTKMKAIYPFVGGTAASHKFNLKDPRDLDAAYRLTFNGGWVHSSTGALGNGTNAYADTKINPSVVYSGTSNSAGISFYQDKATSADSNGCYDASSRFLYGAITTGVESRINANVLPTFILTYSSDAKGLFSTLKNGNDTVISYRNGVNIGSVSNGTLLANKNIYIGARNGTSGIESYSSVNQRFIGIHVGLSDAESANLYTAVQKYQTTLGRQVGVPVVADTDAQAFLNAAVITDTTQANAVNTLVTSLKSYGIWTKMKAIYPFVGGTASSHKFNLKDPRDLDAAYRLVFNGGWVHSSTGALPNGTTGYADTKIIPSSSLLQDNIHVSYYSKTNNGSTGADFGTMTSSLTYALYGHIRYTDGKGYFRINRNGTPESSVSISDSRLFYMINRTSTGLENLFTNTTKNTFTYNSTGLSTASIYLGALNAGGTPYSYGNKESAFASIGYGLTDTEATNLYTLVQAYQTSLGRQIGTPVGTSSIVTNGLYMNLDASNPSSYSGTGTWTDLVSGNNGSLVYGTTYSTDNGGVLVFDGINDNVSSFSSQISGSGTKTIDVWFKSTTTGRAGLCGTRDGYTNSGWVFTINRTSTGNLSYFHTGGSILEVAAGITTNTWYNAVITYDSQNGLVNLYLNGTLKGSTTFTAIYNSSFNGVIGGEDGDFTTPTPFKGNISSTRIYNRALSATEVLQNYNATKSRFGL